MFYQFFGRKGKRKGCGKTSLATFFAIKCFEDKKRKKKAQAVIEKLNSGGYKKLKLPQDLVYSDYDIRYKDHFINFMKCTEFRVPNRHLDKKTGEYFSRPYRVLAPYSLLVFDEAYRAYNSRAVASLDDDRMEALHTSRHNDIDAIFISPRFMDIDKLVRETIDVYVQCNGVKTKNVCGKTITIWDTYEYDDPDLAERGAVPVSNWTKFKCWVGLIWPLNILTVHGREYREMLHQILEDNKLMRKKTWKFAGNIFEYYDSQYYRPKWYNEPDKDMGRIDSDLEFDIQQPVRHNYSVVEYDKFNDSIN